jgi:hypothetical protein
MKPTNLEHLSLTINFCCFCRFLNKLRFIKYLICFTVCFSALNSRSQEEKNVEKVTTIAISDLGISHENILSKNNTIKIKVGFVGSILFATAIANNFLNPFPITYDIVQFNLHNFANLSFRHYYNFQKRQNKGKNISKNSGNYIGVSTRYIAPPFARTKPICRDCPQNVISYFNPSNYDDQLPTGFVPGLVWGLQRNYKSRFNLDFNIGVGYSFKASAPNLISDLSLGIWLGKKNN